MRPHFCGSACPSGELNALSNSLKCRVQRQRSELTLGGSIGTSISEISEYEQSKDEHTMPSSRTTCIENPRTAAAVSKMEYNKGRTHGTNPIAWHQRLVMIGSHQPDLHLKRDTTTSKAHSSVSICGDGT